MEHLVMTVKLLVKFVTCNKYYKQSSSLNHPARDLKKASLMFCFYFQWAERLLAPDLQQGRMRQQTPQCPALELHTGHLGLLGLGKQLPQCPLVMWRPELCAGCWSPGWKQAAPCLLPHGQALMVTKNQHIITGERTGSMSWWGLLPRWTGRDFVYAREILGHNL